ncbi:L-threonylcarbamoyladenylate synthase [Methylotenera sp.]|jgi:tRNA threonylcarbamoyl adenosine modification protein (Sua5/YciO/YrdC/YwlC family)|uniref:L-threonylcarbamoyladenylate synthase n=2 Tax=Methylotenera sp. TaxID=2051956 RepID=UPI0027301C71|nr:L-threonylcarbamoyladenylate synthase [Methylotenera sp.]MDP2231147.1 L-threonylcarbamoyladenylate synthase [Methylotenera sp.]MDP3142017.1 L-threonylcarbamoyladenylate synthase [Methylotenera sp.]MDP3308527.1 L-threonylcarbamoyladenylate synthase [Methylotenera sp.]
MSQFFNINAENPQHRLIGQTADILRGGGVIAYPTDSGYALGCMIGHGDAQARIRQIRGVDDKHLFTLVCRNLSELGNYAIVSNSQFRLLKANTPGPYTFILNATREVPRKLQHPKRNTVGLRVPQHAIVQAILEAIDAPLLSMTLYFPDDDSSLCEAWEIREKLEHNVDLVIDAGHCVAGATSVINLTDDAPVLIREGLGDLAPFGLS